ncbi:MAG: succinylglutamate desuccinylase/aspartoacylase family protein [Proteobacteria bacterium]|nr:succinylglutamate desuccinylase/aspartoacylase family protein [Pseudomonadota bacterium]MBI3496120.1 succinylglutamate desuccinylase/aspartoacylase family protein [Pseudomonadota bacterium]
MSKIRRVAVSHFSNGAEVCLYIHEIAGKKGKGPLLGISGAIHGNEPTGTYVIREIARHYADGNFRGRLWLLPVANPLAFQANKRVTPVDGQNLNRVFPGKAQGMFTDLLAAKIKGDFLDHLEVYLDFHTGTDRPTVDYTYIHNALDLSRAFGTRYLFRPQAEREGPVFNGTSKAVTTARGVPSVTIELGGGVVDQAPYIARGVEGIKNIMRTLNMVDEPPAPPITQTVLGAIPTIFPTQGGFLYTESPPLGEEIAGGAVLGRVVSPYTFEELEVICNPVKRGVMILTHLTANLVEPGDYGYMVGDLDGSEALPGVRPKKRR